ncbi:MAG: glycosyltransferase family 39 protein [Planctomycetota bacterium]
MTLAIGLGAFPLVDVDEPRFATASRHMAFGEFDWIVPRFNGDYRFDKPILIYWLQAACMKIFGPLFGSEFGARLPSAIAVALTVPFVAGIGRMLGLRSRWALLAALMVPSAGIVQLLGRTCTADALLLGLAAFTAWVQVRLWKGFGGWRTWALLGLGIAALTLTKGPPAWIGPAALAIGLWRESQEVSWGKVAFATLGGLVGFLAWALPANWMTDGAFLSQGVGHHVIDRASQPFEGHGGYGPHWLLFYVYMIPVVFLPWSLFAWRGLHRAHRGFPGVEPGAFPGTDPNVAVRICKLWLGWTALVFTISISKLPHYPVPAFPALAIWITLGLQRARDVGLDTQNADRIVAWCLRVLGVLFAVALIVVFPLAGLPIEAQGAVTSLVFLGGFLLAAHRWRNGHARGALLATAMTSLLGFGLFGSATMPKLRQSMIEQDFKTSTGWLPRDQIVHQFALSIPSLVFYSSQTVEKLMNDPQLPPQPVQALQWMLEPGHMVLTRRSKLGQLAGAVSQMPVEHRQRLNQLLRNPPTVSEGFLPSKGKVVELVLLGD